MILLSRFCWFRSYKFILFKAWRKFLSSPPNDLSFYWNRFSSDSLRPNLSISRLDSQSYWLLVRILHFRILLSSFQPSSAYIMKDNIKWLLTTLYWLLILCCTYSDGLKKCWYDDWNCSCCNYAICAPYCPIAVLQLAYMLLRLCAAFAFPPRAGDAGPTCQPCEFTRLGLLKNGFFSGSFATYLHPELLQRQGTNDTPASSAYGSPSGPRVSNADWA